MNQSEKWSKEVVIRKEGSKKIKIKNMKEKIKSITEKEIEREKI